MSNTNILLITRKPSWREGKRMAASCMKAPSKVTYSKSTVSGAVWLTVSKIFSRMEFENRHFCPLYCDCRPHSGGTQSNIIVICTLLKSTFSGLQFSRWRYGCIFVRLAVVASQICKIMRNSEKIRTYSRSGSSEVIDLGANRKRVCDFLLIINSKFDRISWFHRFHRCWYR